MSDDLRTSSSLDSTRKSPQLDLTAPPSHVEAGESKHLQSLRRKQRLSSIFSIICSGFALISDGLQNNLFTMFNVIAAQIYGKAYNSAMSTRLSNSLTVGTILGQISIGILCDVAGRKAGIIVSTVCIVVGIILATAAKADTLIAFSWFMTIARGLTGIGVGGEYPSSSVSAVEAANEKFLKQRGPTFILVTNLVLSFGGPLASILYLIVFEAVGGLKANLEVVWRVVFGLSVIPPLAVFVFRLRMINSQLYRKGAIQKRVPYGLTVKYYWRSLVGTCLAWFLYDFVTFPNGVFSGTIIAQIVKASGHELVRKTAEYQLLLGALALPGCVMGALIVNRLGRRNLMILGFSGYLVIGLIVGCAYNQLIKIVPLFVVLYGLMQSFGNLGPGNSLGLVSAESYATAVRGTCYGLSAAIGKVGAVAGTQSFTPLRARYGARWTFIVAAICGVLGIVVAFFFIRNDLGGDLAEEDRKFAEYLQSQGWSGDVGVKGDEALLDDSSSVEGGKKAGGDVKEVEVSE